MVKTRPPPLKYLFYFDPISSSNNRYGEFPEPAYTKKRRAAREKKSKELFEPVIVETHIPPLLMDQGESISLSTSGEANTQFPFDFSELSCPEMDNFFDYY